TIPNVLQAGDPSQAFTFHVFNSSNVEVATKTLTFNTGDTTHSVDVTGLEPGSYTVKEDTATGWQAQDPQIADLTSACSGGVQFANANNPANASAVKITDPAGSGAGWDMTLKGPGAGVNGETVTTGATGTSAFLTQLQEGS